MNNPIDEIAGLISENPGFKKTDIARVRMAVSKTGNPALAGPRTHGSKVVLDTTNIGLFDAVDSKYAEKHQNSAGFTYLVFPIKPKYNIVINAIPSYLLPKGTKVEVAISPKGTPQIVADDSVLGFMDPSRELCVIINSRGEFVTWFPTSEEEEPWNMTALKTVEDHMHLAKAGRTYRISELESYLGGSFDVVRKSRAFRQER
jgi:hypothetical protein